MLFLGCSGAEADAARDEGVGTAGVGNNTSSTDADASPESGGSSASGGSKGESGSSSGGAATGGQPVAPAQPNDIPIPTGPCPQFSTEVEAGTSLVFAPPALAEPQGRDETRPSYLYQRRATVWVDVDKARAMQGPLVFYWVGTNGEPSQARFALTREAIAAVVNEGGLVVAPEFEKDPDGVGILRYSWYIATGRRETYDLIVADEIVACANAELGLDIRRIHSAGVSAGGMQTVWMAYMRPYVASIVSYSGSLSRLPEPVDEANKFASLTTHGGPDDTGGSLNFMVTAEALHRDLTARGHFSVLCDDTPNGHGIPDAVRPVAWQFLRDHPYGVSPPPYADVLPAAFPAICSAAPLP
jgi:hypothetical protein